MSWSFRVPSVSRERVIFLGAVFFMGISFSWAFEGPSAILISLISTGGQTVSPRLAERTKRGGENPHGWEGRERTQRTKRTARTHQGQTPCLTRWSFMSFGLLPRQPLERPHRVLQLFLGVEEVRGEPDARVGAEVAHDLAIDELVAEVLGVRVEDGDRASPVLVVAGGADLEAGLLGQRDQVVGEGEGALADLLLAHAGHDLVAGTAGVEGRDVRRAGEEAPGRLLAVMDRAGTEGEGLLVRLPAHQGRLQRAGDLRVDPQVAGARTAAEPLDRAAHRGVYPPGLQLQRHRARGLVDVEQQDRPHLAAAAEGAPRAPPQSGPGEGGGDRHQPRPLVDGRQQPL